MQLIGRPSQRDRGVGSIIGAVFVALIFLSGFTFYAVTQGITQHYNDTMSSMSGMDWNRNQEKIVIKQIAITSTNKLNVTAENDGSIQSHLTWLGIFNKTATPENQTYQALNEFVRPGETDNIVSNFAVIAGNKYAIQLVTELGNVVESKFYPASYVSCALTLVTAPPTVYQGSNVTVLLTVTPNDTVVDSIQSLTVTLNATPTNLVQLVSNSSLSASSLMRGTSVFFWWVYNAANTGTVSFNATYLQAPAGTYALMSVNILASPGQGGSGSVSIIGVNGTAEYNPSQWNPLGAVQNVSGSVADLASNNSNYMTFRSYQTASAGQTLYAHSETTNVANTSYYFQRLASPDGPATNLSVSMGTVGKQVWGNFLYPLTGVSSIPASVWGTTYSAWRDSVPAIAFDSASSVETSTAASSVSWSHTTGTGFNRLLLVAVGVHVASGAPTTVASVTYGGVPLTQVTTALYSAGNPQVRSYIFNLTNPASGTNTIAITFAASTLYVCGAVTYSGVDQTNPIQSSNTATGSGTSQSVTVTVSGAGRAVFGHLSGHRTAATASWTITEGLGQNNRWSRTTNLYKGRGSDELNVTAAPTTMSWTTTSGRPVDWVCSAVVVNPATAVGHCNVDVLIRKSDNTVRTIIATNAAGSVDLTTTPSTITGAYSFPGYTVVDQTDYLEIDYYVQVTTAASGVNAYLRIDDPVLDPTDQTKTINVMLPSEYTAEVEFTGSSNLQTWTRLLWQVQSCWDVAQVTVTVQFYNSTLGNYTSNGNGYVSYVSSATPNTNELESQTETSSPNDFKNSTGQWLMKIKGVKFANTQFLMKVDWISLQTTYSTMGDTVSYNVWQWYSLKATTATGDPIPYAYVSVYVNGTSIALRNATDKVPVTNPAWVRLDAVGEFRLEVKSASGSVESFVLYAVVGSIVGQKTIMQEAP